VWIDFDPQVGHEQSIRKDVDVSIQPEVTLRNKDLTEFSELTGVIQADQKP